MNCENIGICGGCSALEEYSLESKIARASAMLGFQNFEVFGSQEVSFRARCELGIYHKENKIIYTMRKGRQFVPIQNCPILVDNLQAFLQVLKEVLNDDFFGDFREKLFAIEALSTQVDTILLTLIYHKKLNDKWLEIARIFKEVLEKRGIKLEVVGRSRGIKIAVDKDFVIEELKVGKKGYFYRYDEGAFSQPNPKVNEKMLKWAMDSLKRSDEDLLEMYCGCGNFTIPFSEKFRKVLATEISKTSIRAAQFACEKNQRNNIKFVRLNAQECIEALEGVREFRRLEGIRLQDYRFSSVFVDPPRAGLGEEVSRFLQRFQNILYISCNPSTLAKDLEILKQTHKISKVAFFDQFPHTPHLESGVLLHKSN